MFGILAACSGNIKLAAQPATPTADSVWALLKAMNFDVAETVLLREVATQLPLAMQAFSAEIVRQSPGTLQSLDKQATDEFLKNELDSRVSAPTRDAMTAFTKTALGQDIVARLPEWHKRYDEQLALLKADAEKRMEAAREEFKERARAISR
jgi:hypothetical protein